MPPKPRAHTKSDASGGLPGVPKWALAAAAAGIAGIVVAVVLITGGGGGDGGAVERREAVRDTMLAADCSLQVVNALVGSDHSLTDPEATSPKWNTSPPTSGPHNEVPAIYNVYDTQVNQAQLVHNLEHGAIAIQYGKDVPEATVAQLKAFYDDHQAGTVLAPLDALGDKIALGAWNVNSETDQKGILAECTAFDDAAFTAFFDEFQFKGPERFSPEAMLPGNA